MKKRNNGDCWSRVETYSYLFACLSCVTIDHRGPFEMGSTVPAPSRDTSNILRVQSVFSMYYTYDFCFCLSYTPFVFV